MKRVLEFGDEEQDEFLLAVRAADWYGVVSDLDGWLRAEIKYMNHDQATQDAYQAARDQLGHLLTDRGLTL